MPAITSKHRNPIMSYPAGISSPSYHTTTKIGSAPYTPLDPFNPPHRPPEISPPMAPSAAADLRFGRRGCCLFPPFLRPERLDAEAARERWWMRGWRKVREWSELVSGPRWKTFLRRFNRRGGGPRLGKFQYDPLSYALNFDEGNGEDGRFDGGYRSFSSRSSVPPPSAKSSMDLGRNAPNFSSSSSTPISAILL